MPDMIVTHRLTKYYDRRRAVGRLLHDLARARLRHALHRNLDRLLDGFMELRVELLAHDRHFVVDRRLRFLPHRLVERVLDLRDHLCHLARGRKLRLG